MNITLHPCAGVHHVEVADFAFDREGGLQKVVLRVLGPEMNDLQIADDRIVAEEALAVDRLAHHGRRDGPAIAEHQLEGGAPALGVRGVVVLLARAGVGDRTGADDTIGRHHVRRLIAGQWDRLAAPGIEGAHAVYDTGRRVGASDVADEATVVLVPANQPDGGHGRQRQVHEAFRGPAGAVFEDLVKAEVIAGGELRRIGLVGDDADRACLGARAIQGALRPLKDLDASNVIDMHIDRAVDGRQRLLIEVGADAGLRARVVLVRAGDDATHVDVRRARLPVAALALPATVGNARQVLHVVVEVLHVQLLELLLAEGEDRDRYVLHVLAALLRGDDDLVERTDLGLLRVRRRRGGEDGRDRRGKRYRIGMAAVSGWLAAA